MINSITFLLDEYPLAFGGIVLLNVIILVIATLVTHRKKQGEVK